MNRSFLVRCIKKMIREHLLSTIVIIVLLIGSILLALLPAQILKYIIDDILNVYAYDKIILGAILYFGCIIFIQLFEMLKESSFVWIGQTLTQTISNEMMRKISRIQTSYFTSVDPALITSYFINDVQTISSVFSSGVIAMIVNCFKIIGIVVSIFYFSSTLALILIILLPFLMIFTRFTQKKMLASQKANRIYLANMTKSISDSVQTARIMQVFHTQKYHQNKFEHSLKQSFETNEKINFYDSLYSPLTQIIRAFVIVLIVFMASDYLSVTGLTIGMCAASIELMTQLFTPIEDLGTELQSIQQAVSGIQRINQFDELEEDHVIRDKSYEDLFKDDFIELKFDHVSFQYDENTKVLKDVSFVCNQERRNVIVGRTGVGKSTMFHLMMGFYQPTSGQVTINGIDPFTIKREDIRKVFGLVDQNFAFIQGTIKEQITLKDERFSEEDVVQVMKLCGLHEMVMSFEKGYETIASESMFSKGQCQLLSVARALISKPKILLLDEMSANLDAFNERKMLEVMEKISVNRLILSITHHTNIIQKSDQVIYLRNGQRIDYKEYMLEN